MSPAEQYRALIESIRLVAASAQDQRRAVPGFVVVTDEIISTLGDALLLLPQLRRAGLVESATGSAISLLESWLNDVPGEGSVADVATLESHEYWKRGRQLARAALGALHEEVRPPDLRHIGWVSGT